MKTTKFLSILCCNLFILLAVSQKAYSETKFKVLNKNVTFDLPSDWQSINKEVGIPLKLMGPLTDGARPVILFVPIDLKDEKLIMDNRKEAEDGYKLSRMGWLQQFNGKSIEFLPSNTYKINKDKIEVHQFGYLYSLNNQSFEEKSFYLRCNNQTFHIKTLIQVEQVEKVSASVKNIVNSFKCE